MIKCLISFKWVSKHPRCISVVKCNLFNISIDSNVNIDDKTIIKKKKHFIRSNLMWSVAYSNQTTHIPANMVQCPPLNCNTAYRIIYPYSMQSNFAGSIIPQQCTKKRWLIESFGYCYHFYAGPKRSYYAADTVQSSNKFLKFVGNYCWKDRNSDVQMTTCKV